MILALARRVNDTPAEKGAKLDLVGTALSAAGLGLIVIGILRSGAWGFVRPKPGSPEWLGLSPVIWLVLAGGVVVGLFAMWENRRIARGQAALIDPKMLRNIQLRDGVTSFFFLFLVQAGIFFVVPLFLSVALGLSAVATGMHLLPLSLALLLFAAGVPKLFPNANPRRVIRLGFMAMFAGLVLLVALLDYGAGAEIVTWPLLLAGAGIGSIASQLGSVTVSAVPDEQSGEVGGIQNTGTQLGASIGTALAGAVLISALTASFLTGVQNNPAVPDRVAAQAQTSLAGGVPFISDADLKAALSDAHVPPADSRRDRADKRAEPDRRAARRRLDPRALRARRPAVHRRHPDNPTRRPNQAKLSANIAMSSAATLIVDRARTEDVCVLVRQTVGRHGSPGGGGVICYGGRVGFAGRPSDEQWLILRDRGRLVRKPGSHGEFLGARVGRRNSDRLCRALARPRTDAGLRADLLPLGRPDSREQGASAGSTSVRPASRFESLPS